jgi:hypothetical protein
MLLPDDVCVEECTCISYANILCRHPCLEMEVCRVGCGLCMKIVVLHDRNGEECHAELHGAWMTVLYLTLELQVGYRHSEVEKFQVSLCITVVILCLFTHRHCNSHNWTVHGWRQVLDCEGITRACWEFWVYSAPNFTTVHLVPSECHLKEVL